MEITYYKKRPTHIRLIQVGLLAFLLYVLSVLPIFISRKLPFFYYGDYNVQQIPFYIQAHRAIRNGELLWNWHVDFGGSMITFFSFYLLGSPFFWITLPFPESFIPHMMPFIMALKYAVCAMTSYFYIRRKVVRDESAILGALLYAFSGFNACNIVFNHFTDVVAFFPLYLYLFENLLEVDHHKDHWFYIPGGRKFIAFALMTMFMSVLNYYFFFGQLVFFAMYFVLCYIPGNRIWQILRMALRVLVAGAIGVLCAGVYFLPSVLSVTGNDRISKVLMGYDMVSYPSMNMLWDILKSMVMIPDIIGKGTVFYTGTVRVSSLAVYLPVFGIAGVVAYFLMTKLRKDPYKRVLLCSLIFAVIPVLNASFSAFNENYYARWFYMPILIMAMVTVRVVERGASRPMKTGVITTSFLFLLILMISVLPSYNDSGEVVDLGLIENNSIYIIQVIWTSIMTIGLILVTYMVPKCIRRIPFITKSEEGLKHPIMRIHVYIALTMLGCVITTHAVLKCGSSLITDFGKAQWEIQMLESKPELPGDEFFRDETDNTATNYDMVWGISSLHSFISTIPGETFNFLNNVADIGRTVETRIPPEYIGLRAILSNKYYLENVRINDNGLFKTGDGIEGFNFVGSQNGFDIYLNNNYIPMGFAYDYYITESDFEEIVDYEIRDRLLSVAVVLDDVDADYCSDIMKELPKGYYEEALPFDMFTQNCEDRKATACESFDTDTHGFTARTANLESEKMIFFSVPDCRGFTVTVDGEETDTFTADYGMMAIRVPAGVHTIRADYVPDGYSKGFVMSVVGLILLIGYSFFVRFYKHH